MDQGFCDIFDLLYRLGISANYTGFFQTARAVELCRAEPERLLLVTKRVYPEVARRCGTSWSAVERNIRTACGLAWKNNRDLLEELAHKPLPQKPRNAQFLAILLHGLPVSRSIPDETEPVDRFLRSPQGENAPPPGNGKNQ